MTVIRSDQSSMSPYHSTVRNFFFLIHFQYPLAHHEDMAINARARQQARSPRTLDLQEQKGMSTSNRRKEKRTPTTKKAKNIPLPRSTPGTPPTNLHIRNLKQTTQHHLPQMAERWSCVTLSFPHPSPDNTRDLPVLLHQCCHQYLGSKAA